MSGEPISLYEHCVRYLRRKRVSAEFSPAELRDKAKHFERNIGCDPAKLLEAAGQPGPIDGYPHTAMHRKPSA